MSTDAGLKVNPEQLSNDVGTLKSLVVQLIESLRERDQRIAKLEHRMDLSVRKVYRRTSDRLRAETALAYIGQLYAIERELRERSEQQWRELTLAERAVRVTQVRRERAEPVLKQFGTWLDAEAPRLLPKEPVRQAVEYARNQWEALNR